MHLDSTRIQLYPSARSVIHLRGRPRQWEDVYRLNEVINGQAVYQFDASQRAVGVGDIIFLKPGWRALVGRPSLDVLSIRFDLPEEAQAGELRRRLPDCLVFAGAAGERAVLKNALSNARDEMALDRCSARARLQVGVALTFFLSGPREALPAGQSGPAKLGEVAREITLHPERRLTTAELAHRAGCSERHLRRLFLTAYGMSPTEFVIRQRVRHAKDLLLHEFASVKDTAYSLGYPDPYSFSQQFKKVTGVAPSQFRTAAIRKCRGGRLNELGRRGPKA